MNLLKNKIKKFLRSLNLPRTINHRLQNLSQKKIPREKNNSANHTPLCITFSRKITRSNRDFNLRHHLVQRLLPQLARWFESAVEIRNNTKIPLDDQSMSDAHKNIYPIVNHGEGNRPDLFKTTTTLPSPYPRSYVEIMISTSPRSSELY